jgi:Tfp pilus assembly protein PilW
MKVHDTKCDNAECRGDEGFSLVEFLMATGILLVITASIFSMLGETQRAASYQTEVQGVLDNTRIAMDTLERIIRQAGNDPHAVGFPGLTFTPGNHTTLQVRSDLTGSSGPTYPDKGDPDGDTNDANENVTIQFSSPNIQVTPSGAGSAQSIANYISAFNLEYYDTGGAVTTVPSAVRKVQITITGRSNLADPQTRQFYSIQLRSDVQLATRN